MAPFAATVLGGHGFIGRHLSARLRALGHPCWVPGRDDPALWQRPLGTVFYCIGLTADFRQRPYDTVQAHVEVLGRLLQRADFERLVYLSSTRVYGGSASTDEAAVLSVQPVEPGDLYNLSKLLGESLALASGRPCRVVRLSNVIGPDMQEGNFVASLLAQARRERRVQLHSALASEKDYLWIADAVHGLIALAGDAGGAPSIVNLASGHNLAHAELAALLQGLGVPVAVDPGAPAQRFEPIAIGRLRAATGWQPDPTLPHLTDWWSQALGGGRAAAQHFPKEDYRHGSG